MMRSRNNEFRVLVVGCGALGARHLQAVTALPMVREVEIVDPRPEALEAGRQLISDMPKRQNAVNFRWVNSLDEVSGGSDLCIVATQAKGRCELIQTVTETLQVKSFLIEKVVSQSVEEYEKLLKFSKENKLSIWVNCKNRTYAIHKYVRQRIVFHDPIVFHVAGGNHGLANNGVHAADLFVFYDKAKSLKETGASIDPILHASKRGKDIFDLSGTIQALSEKGSHFTLSYAGNHQSPDTVSISTPHYRCIIDHMQRWAVESDANSSWNWKTIPFEGNLMVSHMSKKFVTDILTEGRCELPTLEDCYPAHHFILNALQPHFNRLLKKENDFCPVT